MEKAYDEIPELLKVAALVEMMPTEIKDMIFRTNEENPDYEKLKQRIFAWAANKVSAKGGPVPMDTGRASYGSYHDGDYHEERGEEMDIGAVGGNVTRYNCGGWGHVSKNCPSQKKGKGKGEPDQGRGKGKGFEEGPKG